MGDVLRELAPHSYTHIFVAGLVFAAAECVRVMSRHTCAVLTALSILQVRSQLARTTSVRVTPRC
jgi:hypothetical protein